MFTWLKRYVAKKAAERRTRSHFDEAKGSHIERGFIAVAMSEIEDNLVNEQRMKLSSEDQINFMMAYECFVLWSLKRGMEAVLKPEEIESAIIAIQRHFAKHAWYRAGAFEKIWEQMQVFMPLAMTGPPPYPLAEMSMAANAAGYPYDAVKVAHLTFGIHVGLTLGRLADLVPRIVRELTQIAAKHQRGVEQR